MHSKVFFALALLLAPLVSSAPLRTIQEVARSTIPVELDLKYAREARNPAPAGTVNNKREAEAEAALNAGTLVGINKREAEAEAAVNAGSLVGASARALNAGSLVGVNARALNAGSQVGSSARSLNAGSLVGVNARALNAGSQVGSSARSVKVVGGNVGRRSFPPGSNVGNSRR
ncbi:MAG: hypothetical protein MMC33_007965 [Icmadophila ericetorum]|nr:hypothetical protein [Icmadophila ericetorum]